MNAVSRGIKNALRSPVRASAIVLMLAISIALVVSMLVARASIDAKISEVKSTAGTNITITPAGVRGFMGGGDPLTAEQVADITATSHITSTSSTLSDQLGNDDTDLESALELGQFGQRQQRFEAQQNVDNNSEPPSMPAATGDQGSNRMMGPRITVTGTTTPLKTTSNETLSLSSGETIDGSGSASEALIGTTLAKKNSLSIGSTFTMYSTSFTVKGIYDASNQFENSGVIVPLKTLQDITSQAGAVTSIIATVDSSDNVETTVTNLKKSLEDKADITSQVEQANQSVSSLEGIASLALGSLIGAMAAGTIIILLSMIIIVRERRREIGVMKAVGGTDRSIITQFMSEALTLTIIGGLVGTALGIAVSGPMTSSLVKNGGSTSSNEVGIRPQGERGPRASINQARKTIESVSTVVTPAIFASSIGIVLLIAIIGSCIPAWFVANIKPASVLRSE